MENLLQEFSEKERTAYLGAIASIATADHHTSEEESNFLKALIQTSGLSPSSEEKILQSAKDNDPESNEACDRAAWKRVQEGRNVEQR